MTAAGLVLLQHIISGSYCTFARHKTVEAEASAGPEVAEQKLQNFEAGQIREFRAQTGLVELRGGSDHASA